MIHVWGVSNVRGHYQRAPCVTPPADPGRKTRMPAGRRKTRKPEGISDDRVRMRRMMQEADEGPYAPGPGP